jgi:hypothetical protein
MMSTRTEARGADSSSRRRDLILLLAAWAVIAATIVLLAKQNFSAPGLYYDEALFAGMAKDFVTGRVHGQHMPDHEVVTFLGRPFPVFAQAYLGALKSWMLIPSFGVFGSSLAVLRSTTVFWAAIALLFLMLGTWRWLGLSTALIAGALLAFDPTYFFLSVLDWGAAVPSFVCRCACLYFAVRWNQQLKLRDAFFLGLFAGLGFFNKADFAVFLMALGLAAVFFYWRQLFAAVRRHFSSAPLACLGFVAGAGPMLLKIPRILMVANLKLPPGEPHEKLLAILSMYDGSYFYRLMNAGGLFYTMFETPTGAQAGLGVALIMAIVVAAVLKICGKQNANTGRAVAYLILAAALVTLGLILLPGAVRIHHMVLVFPLPQLLIGTVSVVLWRIQGIERSIRRLIRAGVSIGLLMLFASQLRVIHKTEQLIHQSGGRGWWSESLDAFCRENRSRSELTIVSLDWGFNEQLIFLTEAPQLAEPFWEFNQTLPPLPANPDYIYLAHPAKYSVLKYDVAYLSQLPKNGGNAEVTPYFDRQNEVAFYTIRFRPQ